MTIGVFTSQLESSYQWILSDSGNGVIIEHYRHVGANKWISQNNRICRILTNLDSFYKVSENDTTKELISKVIAENFENFL